MNVQDIVNQTATANQPSTADRIGSNKLGKDEFLKLMLAQLANQDPTKPQDSQAFAAQLAQFSSVEQLENANRRLDDILLAQASSTQSAATGLVGKDASYRTDQVQLTADGSLTSGAWLHGDATDVKVKFLQNGTVVRTMDVGAHGAGQLNFTWNGRKDDGGTAAAGTYEIRIEAKNDKGEPVEVETRASGFVRGVAFENGSPELLIGDQRVAMSQIVEINQRSNP